MAWGSVSIPGWLLGLKSGDWYCQRTEQGPDQSAKGGGWSGNIPSPDWVKPGGRGVKAGCSMVLLPGMELIQIDTSDEGLGQK